MISKGRVIRIGLFFAILNFLITASVGVLLRYNSISPVPALVNRYWVHAHSHTGFLGWVFMILATFCFAFLLPKNSRLNRIVYRLIVYFQVAVLGMLVTFPFMGYAAPSIVFSTFHMILSIVFVKVFFKYADRSKSATKFMKAGLIFMLFSSIGPLALGPILAFDMRDSYWYESAIYFYLHFQYNGWFTLAVFALLVFLLEKSGIKIETRKQKLLYSLLIASVIMTLALSGLGFGESRVLQVVGVIGAILQLLAGIVLLQILFAVDSLRESISNVWARWFFGVALFSWLAKITMQLLSVFPVFTDFVYLSRDAIMTYLHLSFLGFTSCFVIGVLIAQNHLRTEGFMAKAGYALFIFGVIAMEFTIGLKSIPQYLSFDLYQSINVLLLIASIMLCTSILVMLFFGFILSNRALMKRQ